MGNFASACGEGPVRQELMTSYRHSTPRPRMRRVRGGFIDVSNHERIRAMEYPKNAFVNARRLTADEATVLRLRSLSPAPVLEDWQRILYQAADILEHLGWCRNTLERGNRHCAVGAIIAAYNRGDVRCEGFTESVVLHKRALHWIIDKVESRLDRIGLMDWNDSFAKSGKNVAALLRASASEG